MEHVRDESALRSFHAVLCAAHEADFEDLPADPIEDFQPLLVRPEQPDERHLLLLARVAGVPVGAVAVTCPTRDNTGCANVDVTVHPAHRRRGHGRALLRRSCEEATAQGRRRLFFVSPGGLDGTDGPAAPLLRSVGARPVLENVRRVLDLTAHQVGAPAPVPPGYRLVSWVDQAPDAVVAGLAYLVGRMTLDAPMGEMDYEQEVWDAERYRAREAAASERGRTRIATAVVHETTGAVAGLTDIGLHLRTEPTLAFQWDTIVDPVHRGHGLGFVLKTHNHARLVELAPQVRRVSTWNAVSNSFMVAVNDRLGFAPAERWTEWQLDL